MGRKTGPLHVVKVSPQGCLVQSLGCAVASWLGLDLCRLAPSAALRKGAAVFIGVSLTWLAMLDTGSTAEIGDSVMIQGSGVLTTCRSWIFFTSCTTHKVRLPERVAAGDKVNLNFGSNTKNYTFEIALIRLDGDACTLMSESSRSDGEGEKIEVARCGPFPDATGQAR